MEHISCKIVILSKIVARIFVRYLTNTLSIYFFIKSHQLIVNPISSYLLAVYPRFLQHFALSSIGQEPILYDHLGVLFSSAELRSPVNCQGDKVRILTEVQWVLI